MCKRCSISKKQLIKELIEFLEDNFIEDILDNIGYCKENVYYEDEKKIDLKNYEKTENMFEILNDLIFNINNLLELTERVKTLENTDVFTNYYFDKFSEIFKAIRERIWDLKIYVCENKKYLQSETMSDAECILNNLLKDLDIFVSNSLINKFNITETINL